MLRRITLAVFAIAVSRNGRQRRRSAGRRAGWARFLRTRLRYQTPVAAYRANGYTTVYAPPVDIPPLVAGYYGKPNSYFYSPYYGAFAVLEFYPPALCLRLLWLLLRAVEA